LQRFGNSLPGAVYNRSARNEMNYRSLQTSDVFDVAVLLNNVIWASGEGTSAYRPFYIIGDRSLDNKSRQLLLLPSQEVFRTNKDELITTAWMGIKNESKLPSILTIDVDKFKTVNQRLNSIRPPESEHYAELFNPTLNGYVMTQWSRGSLTAVTGTAALSKLSESIRSSVGGYILNTARTFEWPAELLKYRKSLESADHRLDDQTMGQFKVFDHLQRLAGLFKLVDELQTIYGKGALETLPDTTTA
jgi:hypothetical protein